MTSHQPFTKEIEDTLKSPDPGTRLEGEIADFLRKNGKNMVSFQRKEADSSGGIGDVDIEVDEAIIEVTTRKEGKLNQLKKLEVNSQLNPSGRPVILYAPYYKPSGVNSTKSNGFLVAQNPQELLDILDNL